MRTTIHIFGLAPLLGLATSFAPFIGEQDFTAEQKALVDTHCPYGLPSSDNVLVRQGYVAAYDPDRRIPLWAAYHAHPDYRPAPERKSRVKSFRKDPDVTNAVVDDDYNGLLSSRGFARGHLAPYFIMGGDRNDSGLGANRTGESDEHDEKTVFQANFMSNIAPQHHLGFNGGSGVWYEVETYIREKVVDKGWEAHVIAGCVLGPKSMEKVGPDGDIEVPPAFFQIVSFPTEEGDYPIVLAFLLPHHRIAHGDPEDFLVSVDVIEALTGLNFFSELDDDFEEWIEGVDTFENWEGDE